jgi:hypothetical protein
VLHVRNTRVKLDEPGMYIYGLETQETERSNMSHIVDMINMKMFTIETTLNSRDDRTWVGGFGSCYTRMTGGMSIWVGVLSNMIN